ncbi:MAG TPA: hypothetical protein ENI23_16710 [bacterium]|nr:hypothetical protein [bacterium]
MVSYKTILLQNIDDEDFMFEYNASEGNPPWLMPKSEVVKYPEFLAVHALKHLIDKILNKRGERTNNQVLRDELANQIIVGEESSPQQAQPTPSEKLRKEVDELNQPSTLDKILTKRKKETEHKEEIAKEEKGEVSKIEERFEGLGGTGTTTSVVKASEEIKKVAKKALKQPKKTGALPTKKELLDFAEHELNMTMDEKTTKKLNKMAVPDLITELNYSAPGKD